MGQNHRPEVLLEYSTGARTLREVEEEASCDVHSYGGARPLIRPARDYAALRRHNRRRVIGRVIAVAAEAMALAIIVACLVGVYILLA